MSQTIAQHKSTDPSKDKFIDIEDVIKQKNPRLLKLLPGFIIRYIKRVLHQDFINDFIQKNGHLFGHDFIERIIITFGCKVEYLGLENIPDKGGVIMASNHPLGGLDAMSLMYVVAKKRKDAKFIVNDILLNLKNLKMLFIPVNKHGKSGAESIRLINEQMASEEATMVFPAGLVSRKQNKEIKDLEWKKSFITKSKQYKRDVMPVFIDGANSSFFYNLALWRKRLGIKANVEMFYLVDEMVKQQSKTIRIIFGKPISWQTFDKSKNDEAWANEIKNEVYKLKYQ